MCPFVCVCCFARQIFDKKEENTTRFNSIFNLQFVLFVFSLFVGLFVHLLCCYSLFDFYCNMLCFFPNNKLQLPTIAFDLPMVLLTYLHL